jgi:hypothetical protein
MSLPRFKAEHQPRLFAEPIGNHGHVRVLLGDIAERLTAKFFNGHRYRTDCRSDYCPDVTAGGQFFEVKTVGKTNHTFIYEGRLKKDRKFYDAGNSLSYVLWQHRSLTRICLDVFELECLFLATLIRVLVVPFQFIEQAALMSPVTKLNSKYGHSNTNPTYGAGYRIPISRVLSLPHFEIEICH